MAIQDHAIDDQGLVPVDEQEGILLDPQPGEIWVARIGNEVLAYGKTLKEAKERALAARPESNPTLDLIAWLWDIGFFQEAKTEGEATSGGHQDRAVRL